jgi:methionyl-tRNA formyltransferase
MPLRPLPGAVPAGAAAPPGAVLGASDAGGLVLACGSGALEVRRIRPAGRNEMDALSWWRGLRLPADTQPRFTTPTAEVDA